MRLSNSNSKLAALRLRGGGGYPIDAKLIATKVARMTVNAAKEGSINAVCLIIACQVLPKCEKWIETICLGGNTDAIVNEIAKNLDTKKHTIIRRLLLDKEIRKNINNILLELELIKEPLSKTDLVRLAAYSVTVFKVPLVKGAIIGARSITLMFITNKIRQVIVSELSGEIAKGVLVAILSTLSSGGPESICGVEEIEKLTQGIISRPPLKGIKAPEGSVASNILPPTPTFNDEIRNFIDVDPVVE